MNKETNSMVEIGIAMRNAREKLGLTTKQLGEMCGKNCSHIVFMENGRYSTIKCVEEVLRPLGLKLGVVPSETPAPKLLENTSRRENYGNGNYTKEKIELRRREREARRAERKIIAANIMQEHKKMVKVNGTEANYGFIKKV